jgi:predicted MFS family arabinose efflux permease
VKTHSPETAALPHAPRPTGRFHRVFEAFQYRDFRIMWLGACTSSIGTWMQQLAQSWLVYDLSGSPLYLGLDAFLGQIPIFLLSMVGGVFADRMDRRRLLLSSQVVQMSCAFTLAILFFTGYAQVWHILCLSFIVGLAQAFGGPAYMSLIPTLVKPEILPNAIALNSIQFNLARVIGPMLGGIALKQLGATWCFALNGASFIAVIVSLLMIRVPYIPPRTTETVLKSMQQGISFIRNRNGLEALIVLAFCMTLFGFPLFTFLPVFVKEVFHRGSDTYTWLLVTSGAGSVAGALFVAAFGKTSHQGRTALFMLISLGVLITAFSLSTYLPLNLLFIFLGSAALISVFALVSSIVQTIITDDMRGRVMSVYNVAFRGGMPIGSLVLGWLINSFTVPATLAVTGVIVSLIGIYFLSVHRRIAQL